MSRRLAVDDHNELREVSLPEIPRQPKIVVILAKIISYIFHPVFVPVYIVYFILYIHPYLYAGFENEVKSRILISSILMYAFFPLVTVGLLKAVKFIDSVFLKTQKDRVIPYVVCSIWYFWMWYVWHNLPDIPSPQVKLALAIFIASFAGLMANISMKVSMHAICVGVLSAFMMTLSFSQDLNFGIYLSVSLFITGLVCTARFIASDHTQKEIYVGLLIGILSQIAANLFA